MAVGSGALRGLACHSARKWVIPGTTIVTTEKDAVKLSPGQLPGLLVAEVELVIDEAQEFEASVLRRFAKV